MVTTPTSTPRGKGNARKTPLSQAAASEGQGGEAADETDSLSSHTGAQRSVVLNIDTEHGDAGELVRVPATDAQLLLKREAARAATKADFGF